jgi:hypothetical protein
MDPINREIGVNKKLATRITHISIISHELSFIIQLHRINDNHFYRASYLPFRSMRRLMLNLYIYTHTPADVERIEYI